MKKAVAVLIAATLGLSCATTALAAEEARAVPSIAFVGQNVPAKSDAKPVKNPPLQETQATKKKSQDKKKDKVPFR